jgi:hypothetical protein
MLYRIKELLSQIVEMTIGGKTIIAPLPSRAVVTAVWRVYSKSRGLSVR